MCHSKSSKLRLGTVEIDQAARLTMVDAEGATSKTRKPRASHPRTFVKLHVACQAGHGVILRFEPTPEGHLLWTTHAEDKPTRPL